MREPTKENTKLVNNDINISIKKVESDYINQRANHKNKFKIFLFIVTLQHLQILKTI
jgi:hypothetical protein